MLSFYRFLTEQAALFPIVETDSERKLRLSRGYSKLVTIDAAAFQREWERGHQDEALPWNAGRTERLATYASVNGYPQVYANELGQVDVLDGRHRIALAASRRQHITVATTPRTVLPSSVT